MNEIDELSDLPNIPSVYALCGGKQKNKTVSYVGCTKELHRRMEQHLIRHNSSITTGTSIVSLNPDLVTEVRWWSHERFIEKEFREAAKEIAFTVLEPELCSRKKSTKKSQEMIDDEEFTQEMQELFEREPSGTLHLDNFDDLRSKIRTLENEVEKLKKIVSGLDIGIKK